MIEKKTFKKTLGKLFQENDFIGKGQSWYLKGEDVIVVVSIQKSSYDEQYYLNFGLWLNTIEDSDFPKGNHCHIQSPLDMIFPECHDLIDIGCSLERGTLEDIAVLTNFLQAQVVPFCEKCLHIVEVRRLFQEGRFSTALVFKAARDMLGASSASK